MVKVFFASKNHTEEVATFKHEDMFKRCLPVLDKFARASKMRVGQSRKKLILSRQSLKKLNIINMATNFSQETMQTILAEYQARVDALQKEIINLKKKLDDRDY